MMLRGVPFPVTGVSVGDSRGNGGQPGKNAVRSCPGVRACSLQVAAVATGEPKSKTLEPSYQPRLGDRLGLGLGSLTEDGLSYKEKFIVRCYEVGINKTATFETIANLLQEVGCNHAQNVGFSTDGFATTTTMRKLHLIWVTVRMHIEIYRYPACKWVMMNQDTRRLQKVSDDVRDEYLVFCPKALRLAFPEENSASLKKIGKLDDPAEYYKAGLVPRRADLDMNQHINNVTYIGWVLESMPQEIIDSHELQTITLDYRRECQHNDIVDSLTSTESELKLHASNLSSPAARDESDNLQFLHLLRLSGDGSEINRGRTIWRKKPTQR